MIELHIAVFLFGLAGLLGKILSLAPAAIVLGRTSLAAVTLGLIILASKRLNRLKAREALKAVPSGALLAAHWVAFFQAIQISSVTVGLLSFATFPVFVAFLEPLFSGSRRRASDVGAAALVFAGLALVVPNYDFGDRIFQGAVWGLASGFTFALLTIWNRSLVAKTDPLIVGLLQNFWAAVVLSPFASGLASLNASELPILLVLGIFCTALAHWLFNGSLKKVRPQTASVAAGLEPVYGILLAALILHEIPNGRELLGGALILLVVMWSSVREKRTSAAQHG